jgi:hypothetical protein
MEFGSNAYSPVFVNYELFVDGYLMVGNSTKLLSNENNTVSSCLYYPIRTTTTFDVEAFINSKSGLIVPHYPVTVLNATSKPFSGQFSVTNDLRGPIYDQNSSRYTSHWTISVTNSGQESIKFLYASLSNDTTLLALTELRCSGSLPQTPASQTNYGQPLASGQTVNLTRSIHDSLRSGSAIVAGKSYKVTVIAVYADYSEVLQTYAVQVSG